MISSPRSLFLLRNQLPLLTGLLIFCCLPGCEEESSPENPSAIAQGKEIAQPQVSSDTSTGGAADQRSGDQSGDSGDAGQETQSPEGTDGSLDNGSTNVGSSESGSSNAGAVNDPRNGSDTASGTSNGDADAAENTTGNDTAGNDSTGSETSSSTNNQAGNSATNRPSRFQRGGASGDAPPETFVNMDPEQKKKELEAKRGKDGVYELTFDDIKFAMETGSKFERELIGAPIEGLSGKRIRIRGYILPTTKQHPDQFILVRDNMECCFGPGAALYDCVAVFMNPGKQTTFTTRPVAVEGTFSIEVSEFEGMVFSIYRMDADSAK